MITIESPRVGNVEPQIGHDVADVVLADHDPISRYVLSAVLRQAGAVNLIACVDSREPTTTWPVARETVVVLCTGPEEDSRATLSALVAVGARVLLVSTCWDRRRVDQAFTLAAKACLIKEDLPDRLACAVQAVQGGHCVISPELLDWYLPRRPNDSGAAKASRGERDVFRRLALLTMREREVLELLADGASTDEVASCLTVSSSTVKSHISRALQKLGARSRLEAVLMIRNA